MTRRSKPRCSVTRCRLSGRWLPLCGTAAALLAWSAVVVPVLPPATWVRTAANVTGALLLLIARRRGLGWQELGLASSTWRPGARWGRSPSARSSLATPSCWPFPPCAQSCRTPRPVHVRVLLLIPVGTVLCEEIAFRGVLLATALRVLPVQPAPGISAVVFGLWYLGSAVRDDQPALPISVVGVVVVTATGGLVLGWLRQRTGSVLAPIGLHLGTNSVGLAAVALVSR